MVSRIAAFVIWAAVAASIVFWAMRLWATAHCRAGACHRGVHRQRLQWRPRVGCSAWIAPPTAPAVAAAPQAQADARFRLIGVVAPRAGRRQGRRAGADRHRRQAAQGLSRGSSRSMANWCCWGCIRAARRSGREASRRRWHSSFRPCRRRVPERSLVRRSQSRRRGRPPPCRRGCRSRHRPRPCRRCRRRRMPTRPNAQPDPANRRPTRRPQALAVPPPSTAARRPDAPVALRGPAQRRHVRHRTYTRRQPGAQPVR